MNAIAFFIDRLCGDDGLVGGTERQLIELISHLDPKGFRPVLFVLRGDRPDAFGADSACEEHMLGVGRLLSAQGLCALVNAVVLLRKRRIVLAQTFFFDATVFGVIAAVLANVRVRVSCRRDMGFWHNPSLLFILSIINRFTHRVLVNAKSVRELVAKTEKVPLSRVDILYNGLDIHAMDSTRPAMEWACRHRLAQHAIICGIVANFNRPVKRLDLFIKAAGLCADKAASLRFLIVGGGSLEGDLRRLTKELGLEDRVVFAGVHEDPVPMIKLFSVGLLTSDSEGLPNTVLQYMGAGIPTVCTAAGGVCEIVVHGTTGLIVPCGDATAIAEALLMLAGDQPLRRMMGARARAEALKFAWPKIVRKYEHYYDSLISEGTPGGAVIDSFLSAGRRDADSCLT